MRVSDLSGLSPRHRAILIAGVRGAEDAPTEPTGNTPAEPTTDATTPEAPATDTTTETAPPAGDAPAEGSETPADGETTEGAPAGSSLPEIPEVPDVLDGIDDEDLRTRFTDLQDAYEARRPHAVTPADVAVLRQIRTDQQRISAALAGRSERENRSVIEPLAELDSTEVPELPDPSVAFASASTDGPAGGGTGGGGTGGSPAAALAAAGETQGLAEQTTHTASVSTRPSMPMLAAAGNGVSDAGASIDMETLGRMVERAAQTDSVQSTHMASIASFDEMVTDGTMSTEIVLRGGDVERNGEILRQASAEFPRLRGWVTDDETDVHTAAICDPLDIIRDIPDAFQATEVVSPAFPSRPIGRLGFQFMPSMKLSDVSAGSAIWTESNQSSVDVTNQTTWKPIIDVVCPPVLNIRAKAVTAALRFDNTTEMSNPERIGNATNALMAVKARNKEASVLAAIDSLSGAYQFTGQYGALPTFAKAVNSLIAQMAYVDRLVEPRYTVFIPRAVSTLLGIDRVSRAFGQDLQNTDVLTELARTLDGVVEVIETADAASGEPGYPLFKIQEPGDVKITVPELNGDYRVRIVDVTGAIYGETGEMNAGVQRSPDLLRMNKAMYFVEEYFLLAKHGPQHWAYIDMHLCDNGARGGTITPYSCSTAS